jgi:FkbM family methyltransferase
VNKEIKILIFIARLIKNTKVPHTVKYIVFLIFFKNKKIDLESKITYSPYSIQLNIGKFIDYWIYMDGTYEEEWIVISQKLVNNKIFIDIGANIGIYSISLSKIATKIYSFEPEINNYKAFKKNVERNKIKNILVYKKAVGSKNKRGLKLYISSQDTGWHSLAYKTSDNIQTVSGITLDTFVDKSKISEVGLIKIDVEGLEKEVLIGSQKVIKKFNPCIIIEFNKPILSKAGYTLKDLYTFLEINKYYGYRLYGRKLYKLKAKDIQSIYNENILFVHFSKRNSLYPILNNN